jgi:hypothetical protein
MLVKMMMLLMIRINPIHGKKTLFASGFPGVTRLVIAKRFKAC